MVWYRTTFILLYEPAAHPTPLNHPTCTLRAPRSGGKISANLDWTFPADGSFMQPLILPFEESTRTSSALISLHSRRHPRRRYCLSEIESRRLRRPAQIVDLALQTYRSLERDRFAFPPAF
jgi:hypothetical protein